MKISLFLEGSYPYVVGGVSQWMQMFMTQMPEHEFILNTLVVDRTQSGKFKYALPDNVVEVHETYLNDSEWGAGCHSHHFRLNHQQYAALRDFAIGTAVDWDAVFSIMDSPHASINGLLMGPDLLKIAEELYGSKYPFVVFSDFLWTIRSMYLPLFIAIQTKPEKADVYHAISTGYAGIMASRAKIANPAPLLLTEHGIYTREREEEIIKADWTKGVYKNMWIDYFSKMSACTYGLADKVVSLYDGAQQLQWELGCEKRKTLVIPNGIQPERFEALTQKEESDPYINIGGVLRITPIKDVKTMIMAFHRAKQSVGNLRLYLMGPTDEDEEYFKECESMVRELQVQDVIFTGRVDVMEYLGKMDIVILTSISEGQPLSILEAMAAKKPCIATNVGSCRQLLSGFGADQLGKSGILTPIMMVDDIARAIVTLAKDPDLCREMGEIGRLRVEKYYQQKNVIDAYRNLYQAVAKEGEK